MAKKKGVYKGRKPALTSDQVAELKGSAKAGTNKTQQANIVRLPQFIKSNS